MAKKKTSKKKVASKKTAKKPGAEVVVFRDATARAYRWRRGDTVSAKSWVAREQAIHAAKKANPNAKIKDNPYPENLPENPEKTTSKENVAPKAADAEVVVFQDGPGGAYRWRQGESVSPKRYMARDQADRAAKKANPDATITHEPEPQRPAKKKTSVKKKSPRKAKGADAKRAKPASEKRPGGLDYAAKVLAEAGEPMSAKTIAERVIAAGWKTNGRTPWATLYAAMTREIADKGEQARFRKVDRGRFAAA